MPKRENYINWDEYLMGVALLAGKRSKDPNSQVGCCIATEDNIIVSVGYNGFPRGCSDDELPWEREGEWADTKYPYVVHAEMNAILNSFRNLKGCKLYVTLFPCNECCKAIIQSGIKTVYYLSDKYATAKETLASKRMFKLAGVETKQFKTDIDTLTIDYTVSK